MALPSPSFGPVTQTRKVGPGGAALRAMRFAAFVCVVDTRRWLNSICRFIPQILPAYFPNRFALGHCVLGFNSSGEGLKWILTFWSSGPARPG